jgi:hypothetical protein
MANDGSHLTTYKQKLTHLKNQLKIHELAVETLQVTHPLHPGQRYPPEIQSILDSHGERIAKIQAHIDNYQDKIKQVTDTQSKFKPTLTIPADTDHDVRINLRDLQIAVPSCVVTGNETNFEAVAKKLFAHGTLKNYSHNNYKQALNFLLNDINMYNALESMKDDPLEHIIDVFKDRYITPKTIADSSHKLDTFVRNSGESLRSAVRRFTQLIHETQDLYQPHQRRTREELEIEKLLLNISSPRAAARLRQMKAKAQKYAQIIPTSQYLDAAEEAEYIYKDRPIQAVYNTPEQRKTPSAAAIKQQDVPEPFLPPLLTGTNDVIIVQQPTPTVKEQEKKAPTPPNNPRSTRQKCRKCGDDDPNHIWATCQARPPQAANPAPKGPRKACYKCEGTHRHTWRTCSGTLHLQQNATPVPQPQPPVRTRPITPQGKPCFNCGSRHLHNWNKCTAASAVQQTPTANTVATKSASPCYQCGSTMIHNWKTCKGIAPQTPSKASTECWKCGSAAYHNWLQCQGIPPHLLNDPEVLAMSQTPNLTFTPRQPPRASEKACYNCGQTYPHTWKTCTNTAQQQQQQQQPRRQQQDRDPQGQTRRNLKACPYCNSQNPHNWNACKAIDALNK